MKGRSLLFSCLLHALLLGCLLISFDRTVRVSGDSPVALPPAQVVQATMVDNQALEAEKQKLQKAETDKRIKEQNRQREVARQQKEARLKREQEERMLQTLKKEKEQIQKDIALHKAEQEKQKDALKKIEAAQAQQAQALEKTKEQAKVAEAQAKVAQAQAAKAAERQRTDQISQHALLIRNKIHQHWRQPLGVTLTGLVCKLDVVLSAGGEVVETKIVQSSGNAEFDRSTELAIRKASPLPMSDDPHIATAFKQFTFTFHPEVV